MLKRVMLISLLVIIVIAFRGTAIAGSIGGWGITITGSALTVDIDLSGVGNPDRKPSIATIEATLTQIEYRCLNPNNHSVAPGSAGERTFELANQVDSGEIVDKGKAVVSLTFDVGPFPCNNNWNFLTESEAAKTIAITIEWFACTGDPRVDDDPCFDENGNQTFAPTATDAVDGVCTLDPIQRHADGTVVLGQRYTCNEIP